MAGQQKLLELDLSFSRSTRYMIPYLTLIDSIGCHNFLSEGVAMAVGLGADCSCHLNVKLVDGEKCA